MRHLIAPKCQRALHGARQFAARTAMVFESENVQENNRSSGLAPAKKRRVIRYNGELRFPGPVFSGSGQCLVARCLRCPDSLPAAFALSALLAARLSTTAEKSCLFSLPSNLLPATRSWA